MRKINMEEIFKTIPKIPTYFTEWSMKRLPNIAIYYHRNKKTADCICGKCANQFTVNELPKRGEMARCPFCGNVGEYEWTKVTTGRWSSCNTVLIQCTSEGKLMARIFNLSQYYIQGEKAKIGMEEIKRCLIELGDVYWFNYESVYTGKGWKKKWEYGKGNCYNQERFEIFPDWEREIQKSELKYCDIEQIKKLTGNGDRLNILITFARNPAIEMYTKAGMKELVKHLLWKEGRDKNVNRRGKNIKQQLRLRDQEMIKRFIESKGNITLLKILQEEQREGYRLNEEQEAFLIQQYERYNGEEQVRYLLRYMSVQKLMNRVRKYREQNKDRTNSMTINMYFDYLQMREELGYDMTNEVYLYPKNLKEKHDLMVKEKNERADELHILKMNKKFEEIAKQYEKLNKKYGYSDGTYVIRPARSAGEIVEEGRKLHHCVGRGMYLNNHDKGRSYILLLRKAKRPNCPYYTIEIRETEILQWYGRNDSKPDKEIIEPWLQGYVDKLKKEKKVLIAAG